MIIIGVDPGSKESAFVEWHSKDKTIFSAKILPNPELLRCIRDSFSYASILNVVLAIEQIRGYGIVAGDDTFDTCEWSGRFREAHESKGGKVVMIPRKEVKRCLCGNTTTNDKYIRMALIERFGEVGTKKNPCPLFGISGHMWSALACAVTCKEQLKKQ
jgi:hypothetical protein